VKKYYLFIPVMVLITQLHAATNDSFNSEISHFIGGSVAAGGVTAIVDHYYPEYSENRAMIGFGISSLGMIIAEGIQIAQDGNSRGQMLDIASHIAGSAFGAFVTDKYILSPVIKNSPTEGKSVGFKLERPF
jgi:hypothetical protein